MRYTKKEWLAEGKRRFGDIINWRFVCPACGRINSASEFKEAGAQPSAMYLNCIGRHNGKGVSGIKHKKGDIAPEFGCDWTAAGLFGTLNGGDIVVDDDGNEIMVFSFAPMLDDIMDILTE